MPTKPIPDGYHSVTPYLVMRDAARAIDFYKRALGATETFRFDAPGGKIGHAEIKVGDSMIMLADEMPDMGYRGPQSLGGTAVSLMVYVEDVDSQFKRAIDAGAKVKQAVTDQFYGDRSGTLEDPFGHVWTIATHKEDVSQDELVKRAKTAHKKMAQEERVQSAM
jgi:PhnB protein